MTEKTLAFREQLRQARPDLIERQAQNARKRAIAIMPRALRDTGGLTQGRSGRGWPDDPVHDRKAGGPVRACVRPRVY
jgi:hypothetical protein